MLIMNNPEILSNHSAVMNHRILRHDDNAIANKIRATRPVSLDDPRFIQQSRILSDARILVDDRPLDDSSLTYPDSRHTLSEVAAHLFECLIVVSAHHKRRINLDTLRDPAAQADDGVCHLRAIDDAAVADYRVVDL